MRKEHQLVNKVRTSPPHFESGEAASGAIEKYKRSIPAENQAGLDSKPDVSACADREPERREKRRGEKRGVKRGKEAPALKSQKEIRVEGKKEKPVAQLVSLVLRGRQKKNTSGLLTA